MSPIPAPAEPSTWGVGDLARHSGVTVRTLHHYEAIGLLRACGRTAAGHRRYAEAELARLQQIRSLRYLGLPLSRIRQVIDGTPETALAVITTHIERLGEQAALQRQLLVHLEALRTRLVRGERASMGELMSALEAQTMVERRFTPEEQEFFRQRREEVGDARIKEVEEQAWPQMFVDVRAEIAAGTEPESARGGELADRWFGLVAEFTGGNPKIEARVAACYAEDPTQGGLVPVDMAAMMSWINRAHASR
jgi:MerR family transcriptional regulator, thiopeptide resistance regulator